LLNLVEAVKLLDPDAWEVIIAGYDENNHQQAVEHAVRDADLQSSFRFLGPVADDEKWDLYSTADLFVLPSFSENFGIVVVEALASGVPVITTRGTPWRDLIAHQCGWWVEPTVTGIYQALQEAVALSDRERIVMGESGRRLVEDKYSWPAIARQFLDVYQWMLGRRKRVPNQIIERSQPLPEIRE
jgi:glycosyltransferase involved in cell wall biosynthesis